MERDPDSPDGWWDRYGHRLEPRSDLPHDHHPTGRVSAPAGPETAATTADAPPAPPDDGRQAAQADEPQAPARRSQELAEWESPDPPDSQPGQARVEQPQAAQQTQPSAAQPRPSVRPAAAQSPAAQSQPAPPPATEPKEVQPQVQTPQQGRPSGPPTGPQPISAQQRHSAPPPGHPLSRGGYGPPPGYPAGPAQPQRPRTAADITDDVVVRRQEDPPSEGWRRALLTATGGLVNPGPSIAELERRAMLERVRRRLPGNHRVAVTSMKGGVGKTTVAICLGLAFAENRGDRTIVIDANPDAGTLADRLTGETTVTVRQLLREIDAVRSWADISRYTSLSGRLQVLASEQDPASSEMFRRDEYERVVEVLARFFDIIVTDSGTGVVHSAMEGTLALADSLVVVGAPTVDGASRASKTLDWLMAHGHAMLAAEAVVVLSCDRGSDQVDRERIREHFGSRCRGVVEIPHDEHLAAGGRVDVSRLRRPTRDAFLQLGALIADRFGVPAGQPSRRLQLPAQPPAQPPAQHPNDRPTLGE
jgi:MinD-like ATPase involved in chromosome partitioning or flagellar assembly